MTAGLMLGAAFGLLLGMLFAISVLLGSRRT